MARYASLVVCTLFCAVLVCPAGARAQEGLATIAVLPFANQVGADIGIQAMEDMLSTSLVRSGKFNVLERSRLDGVLQEQNLGASGAVNPSSAAQIGSLVGADFIVLGVVTEADVSADGFSFGGIGVKNATVSIAIDIRIVDSSKGVVRYADTFRDSQKDSSFAVSDIQVAKRQIGTSQLSRSLIDNIARRIFITLYPPTVISVSESKEVTINYGDVLFSKGQRWAVFTEGQELIDPVSGASLGRERQQTGEVLITDVQAKLSRGVVQGEGAAYVGSILDLLDAASTDGSKPDEEKRGVFSRSRFGSRGR